MRTVFRGIYRLVRLALWLQRAVGRRFTRMGLVVLGALILAGALGVDTENTVTYQAFALLFCLLAVSAGGSWFLGARFGAARHLPRFGTVGHPLTYLLTLKNETNRVQKDLVVLEDVADPRPPFEEWLAAQRSREKESFRLTRRLRINPFKVATVKEAPVGLLPPGGSADVRGELTPLRRGVLRLDGVTIARPDPLGLIRGFAKVSMPRTVMVLPKRYPLPPVAMPGWMKYQQGGVALATNVGQSEEFVALREYREGDPLRHIHWRSWAKVGQPVVKEFADEFFVRHALVLDTITEHAHTEVFEEAVSVAASFACTLQTQESLLDLLFVGGQAYCFTAGRGLAHADQILEVLAAVQACREQPFETLAHLVLDHVNLVSGCVLVLQDWDAPRRNLVEKLLEMGVPVLVLVIVEPGGGAALEAGPLARDPERFRVLEAGRIEQSLAQLK